MHRRQRKNDARLESNRQTRLPSSDSANVSNWHTSLGPAPELRVGQEVGSMSRFVHGGRPGSHRRSSVRTSPRRSRDDVPHVALRREARDPEPLGYGHAPDEPIADHDDVLRTCDHDAGSDWGDDAEEWNQRLPMARRSMAKKQVKTKANSVKISRHGCEHSHVIGFMWRL
jgi:hypothetical protein